MRILVTGGAGYIGNTITRLLIDAGHQVRILDNLSTGHRSNIPPEANFIEGSILDPDAINTALHNTEAVIHCAGKSLVGESVEKPDLYHYINVEGSRRLITGMTQAGVTHIVFSSSAAVYAGHNQPLTENSPEQPNNPYGATKLLIDRMLKASGFTGASLRYFNVAGALHHNGTWYGENHTPETHLIPNTLTATPDNPLKIYGNDYPTPDGTAIRDYIHVIDLAHAHLAALNLTTYQIINLGTNHGSSVTEVIHTAEHILGRPVPHIHTDRRSGDPTSLVAANHKAHQLLGWHPTHTLTQILHDAHQYHTTR